MSTLRVGGRSSRSWVPTSTMGKGDRALILSPQLLQFDPQRRLGAGGGGASKLKSHPFFSTIQWSRLVG